MLRKCKSEHRVPLKDDTLLSGPGQILRPNPRHLGLRQALGPSTQSHLEGLFTLKGKLVKNGCSKNESTTYNKVHNILSGPG